MFFKFGQKTSANDLLDYSSPELVEWNRSYSLEASLQCSRSDSIMSFMSRGVGELRDGIRVLRQRARSLRPLRRPHSSVTAPVRLCSNSVSSQCTNQDKSPLTSTQVDYGVRSAVYRPEGRATIGRTAVSVAEQWLASTEPDDTDGPPRKKPAEASLHGRLDDPEERAWSYLSFGRETKVMQCSATSSLVSHFSEDRSIANKALLSSQSTRRGSTGTSFSDSPCLLESPECPEKRVNFLQAEP
ncbi:hypothetical protein GCK32_013519, partial [Trichostrongylus colubriformis]